MGSTEQTVAENKIGNIVRAEPDTGYVFTCWSDGYPDAERTDLATFDKTVTAQFRFAFSGQGTEQSPYQIDSYQALIDMRHHPKAHYILTADLDLANISHIPVFDDLHRFGGEFNGNGHTIKNLTINTDEDFPSLFGFSNGNIYDLTVTDFDITVPDLILNHPLCVGAVCAVSNGELKNITVSGKITSNKLNPSYRAYIGGIGGIAFGAVRDCSSDIQMQIDDELPTVTVGTFGLINIGGLIGCSYDSITSCSTTGKVTYTSQIKTSGGVRLVGGMVAVMSNSDITDIIISDCTSNVEIQTTCNVSCGGLLGYFNMPNATVIIKDCNYSGNITVGSNESGLACGFANNIIVGSNSVIKNCYSTGNITSYSANGFTNDISGRGDNVVVLDCYTTGELIAISHANGFADGITNVTITNCYSSANTNGAYCNGFANTLYDSAMHRCFATGDVNASSIACGQCTAT